MGFCSNQQSLTTCTVYIYSVYICQNAIMPGYKQIPKEIVPLHENICVHVTFPSCAFPPATIYFRVLFSGVKPWLWHYTFSMQSVFLWNIPDISSIRVICICLYFLEYCWTVDKEGLPNQTTQVLHSELCLARTLPFTTGLKGPPQMK